jgi:ABC transport permease subunit
MTGLAKRWIEERLLALGEMALLLRETVSSFFTRGAVFKDLIYQIYFLGVKSQSVVLITGAFTGMVLCAQTYYQFHKVKMDSATLAVVSVSMLSELGPVLTALMVAGRVGAAMAAELGTMRVTEQIDALRTLATHPVDYLVVPRVFATIIAMPLLTIESVTVGIFSGYLVGVHLLNIDATYAVANMVKYSDPPELWMGIIKGTVFGGIIATISSYKVVFDQGALPMIQVKDLHKSFGTQKVLEGVTFDIATGETAVIIGRSGCGKSVLLKHIIGLMEPDSGEVIIGDQSLTGLNERQLLKVRRRFGMLFQSAALFDSLTVAENISFVLRREGKLTDAEIAERVAETLEMVDLPGTENKKPGELSGGMRKRVGLARAIIYRPEILLYDEPTTGLDPVVSDSIDQLIVRVCEKLQVTSVVVTHDTRSMRKVGNRIIMLHQGKVHAIGTPEEIFSSTDSLVHRFVNGISDPKEHDF